MQFNIDNLVAEREHRAIFGPLSFSAQSGEYITIHGANGAGKSTLLRILAGLLQPKSGSITIKNQAQNFTKEIYAKVHYFGHSDGLKNEFTIRQNLSFYQQLYSIQKPKTSIYQALKHIGLECNYDLLVKFLSAGMRKRVALARLLINFRPIWLLDEPNSHLDHMAQKRLTAMISKHMTQGGIVIAAIHQPLAIQSNLEIKLN